MKYMKDFLDLWVDCVRYERNQFSSNQHKQIQIVSDQFELWRDSSISKDEFLKVIKNSMKFFTTTSEIHELLVIMERYLLTGIFQIKE